MNKLVFCTPLLLLACTGCTHNPHLQPDQTASIPAKVLDLSQKETRSVTTLTGVIAARQVAVISAQVMAPITQVAVREGDSVRAGSVLVRLSSVPLQAAVEQAQGQLLAAQKQQSAAEAEKNLAAQTYARYAVLNQRHSVTPQEFDQVKAQLAAADAQVQAAAAQTSAAQAATRQSQATSGYTVIRAPFSGIVTRKYVDAGSIASPGIPLLEIEDAKQHEADVQVNESVLNDLHAGEQVQVSVNNMAKPLVGKIREIVPSGDPAAHTFTVKVGLPVAKGIYSGMTADVLIPATKGRTMLLPKSAIRHRGQLDSVLLLDPNSVAQIRYVTLGRQVGDSVEIISGLSKGDRVLANPNDAWIGHRIEPQNE
ncbi:MAG TPA: efflux RND transporter periplasmic adaptor subunit [Acidobacteriaceae bacterium]|nr:efflux RND transporter periplasmic adaptor subunit [Acidobacteriaceae bacterium]